MNNDIQNELAEKQSYIHPNTKFGKNFQVGRFVIIEDDVEFGDDVSIGNFVRILPGARIGNNVIIMDFVKFMPNTVIGNNCKIDDYVNTSGYVKIGNNVRIKRCSMIGQAVQTEDNVWIGSGISTTRIKYPRPSGDEIKKEEWVTLKSGCVIGSRALLLAGITVGEGAIVAAGATVTKDCEPYGVYIGAPARLVRRHEK